MGRHDRRSSSPRRQRARDSSGGARRKPDASTKRARRHGHGDQRLRRHDPQTLVGEPRSHGSWGFKPQVIKEKQRKKAIIAGCELAARDGGGGARLCRRVDLWRAHGAGARIDSTKKSAARERPRRAEKRAKKANPYRCDNTTRGKVGAGARRDGLRRRRRRTALPGASIRNTRMARADRRNEEGAARRGPPRAAARAQE